MLPPSPDTQFTRPVDGREGASSQASRAPSPYRGLYLWDQEEDLIRLHTPESEAHIQPVRARAYGAEIENASSSKPWGFFMHYGAEQLLVNNTLLVIQLYGHSIAYSI